MTKNYQNPPGRQLRSPEEALAAIQQNKDEASRKAKRGWNTRRQNIRSIDRMIGDAVERDTR